MQEEGIGAIEYLGKDKRTCLKRMGKIEKGRTLNWQQTVKNVWKLKVFKEVCMKQVVKKLDGNMRSTRALGVPPVGQIHGA